VYSDPIAKVPLAKLRRSHVLAWRHRLESKPALVSRRKVGDRVTRPRSPATINRDMAALRAALGAVLPLGSPNTEAAWQEPLKPLKNAVKKRTLYLSRTERRALLRNAGKEAVLFVRALCQLPLRPGAVAGLIVDNFDKRTRELTIMRDKAGSGRRILVPQKTATLFTQAAKGKARSDLLFCRANGRAWNKDSWKQPIAEAARKAKLPTGVTAYTLRHSTITDLVSAGLPLLTIAQISGTSAHMIEKHYGHLVPHSAVDAALGSLAL
jgi:integrase